MQETEDDEVFEASGLSSSSLAPRRLAVHQLHSVDSGYGPTTSRSSHIFSDSEGAYGFFESTGRTRSRSVVERPANNSIPRTNQLLATTTESPSSSNQNNGTSRLSRRASWPELLVDGCGGRPWRAGEGETPAATDRNIRRVRTDSVRSVGTQTSGSLESLLEAQILADDDDPDGDDNVFFVGSTGPLPDVIQPPSRRAHSVPVGGNQVEIMGQQLRHLADDFRGSRQRSPTPGGRHRRRTWSLQESFRFTSHIEIRTRRWSVLGWGEEDQHHGS